MAELQGGAFGEYESRKVASRKVAWVEFLTMKHMKKHEKAANTPSAES